MASSEEKRHRQSLKRQVRNQATKSKIKTLVKKVLGAVGADPQNADAQLRTAVSAIHKAGRKRVLHPNTAARRVARLSRAVHRAQTAAQSTPTPNA